MKKSNILNLMIILVILSPIGYLLITWNSTPENFTTKFDFTDQFQKVQSRNSLLLAVIIISAVSSLLYILMRNLKKVDPKVTDSTPGSAFNKLGLLISIFLLLINYFLILSSQNNWVISSSVAIAFLGLLVMLIGNYMNNLKPNYFAGIRLPWTLNDPENWRRTHQLAAKLWFAGGLVLIVISFFLPKLLLFPFMVGLLILLTAIPSIYSYRIYRSKLT